MLARISKNYFTTILSSIFIFASLFIELIKVINVVSNIIMAQNTHPLVHFLSRRMSLSVQQTAVRCH